MPLLEVRPGMPVAWTPQLDDGARFLARRARAGDVVLTLGAGDVDRLPDLVLEARVNLEDGVAARPLHDARDGRARAGVRPAGDARPAPGRAALGGGRGLSGRDGRPRLEPARRRRGRRRARAEARRVSSRAEATDGERRSRRAAERPTPSCLHRARSAGLGGFEFACAIPGTTGGGVWMNAGAYGGDFAGCSSGRSWSITTGHAG